MQRKCVNHTTKDMDRKGNPVLGSGSSIRKDAEVKQDKRGLLKSKATQPGWNRGTVQGLSEATAGAEEHWKHVSSGHSVWLTWQEGPFGTIQKPLNH